MIKKFNTINVSQRWWEKSTGMTEDLQVLYTLAKAGNAEILKYFKDKYNLRVYTDKEIASLNRALNKIRKIINNRQDKGVNYDF